MHENEAAARTTLPGRFSSVRARRHEHEELGLVHKAMADPKPKRGRAHSHANSEGDDSVYEMQVRICKALANPTRMRILDLLGKQVYTVSGLQRELGIPLANVSVQLAILRSAGVVTTQKKGKEVHCSLALPEVRQACHFIRQVLRAQVRNAQKIAV